MGAANSAGSNLANATGGNDSHGGTETGTSGGRHSNLASATGGGTDTGTSYGRHSNLASADGGNDSHGGTETQHDATTGIRRRNEGHVFAELSDRSATTDQGGTFVAGGTSHEGATDAAATDAAASHEGATDAACHRRSGGRCNPMQVA